MLASRLVFPHRRSTNDDDDFFISSSARDNLMIERPSVILNGAANSLLSSPVRHWSSSLYSVPHFSGVVGVSFSSVANLYCLILSLGYPTFKGQVLNGRQLWDLIEGLEENELLYYTHLLTGYIGSVSFLNNCVGSYR
ncbi:pyridoxal kinase isoform X2 [Cucumis melo var. makuwa]|uniref:pyridoxal kinase n=1 Tax=Cucumis melo var. makuwa TaxID=1194695 RepID=A0A5D3D6J3_CUCMM|nr:pyridoxal kinase isoform X2 [Cucumis melo var. makuwa]